MNTGTYISGAAHLALIAWVMLSGLFSAAPSDSIRVTDVTILSGEEFAALTAPAAAPRPADDVTPPDTPEISSSPRPVPAPETRPERPEPPAPQDPAEPDTAPDTSGIAPLPEAEAVETVLPPVPPEVTDAPEAPTLDTEPPRPAPRVAPEPAAPPPEDVAIADIPREATRPDEAAETAQPEEEAAAPEEASTQIVTEAEERPETGLAMASSPRPRARPARPREMVTETAAAPPEPETPAAPAAEDAIAGAVADAVAQAMAGAQSGTGGSGTAPTGPPLTAGERDALRVAVSRCWNVGSLSTEALMTSVVVGLDMAEDGKPVTGSIDLLSWSGGSEAAARQTFESARRAIIRCGAAGFPLPVEKYAQWREIEMTFNPENMRIR